MNEVSHRKFSAWGRMTAAGGQTGIFEQESNRSRIVGVTVTEKYIGERLTGLNMKLYKDAKLTYKGAMGGQASRGVALLVSLLRHLLHNKIERDLN